MRRYLILSLLAATAVAGCKTTQPVAEVPVVVEVPTVPSCFSVSTLQRVEIPAETRTVYATSSIDNGPYDAIEGSTTAQEIVTRQAQVIYVNAEGREVTNICEGDAVIGPVGPAEGELLGGPVSDDG